MRETGDNAAVARVLVLVSAVLGFLLAVALAPAALASDGDTLPPLTIGSFVLGWQFDATVWLPAFVAVGLWLAGVRRVSRAHSAHPVARVRTASWIAGVAVIVVALDSGIGRYDDTLFSVHMVQHLLLTLVAPPLLLFAGPVTLLLQAASPEARRRWVLPLLHSRAARTLSHPVVAWVAFAVFLWYSHFSPLFEASLENGAIHNLEHALYLATALLFWWPVVGRDPSPWRLGPAVGALYVGLQMPQMSFLAVAILMAPAPLYPAYATADRSWGPTPLADQQIAAGIMWVGANLVFIGALMVLVWVWMRQEERRAVRDDQRLDAERASAHRIDATGQPSGGTGEARYSR
jgi:putative copper resistance protein D